MICLTVVITLDSIITNHKIDKVFSSNKEPKQFNLSITQANGNDVTIGSINSIFQTSAFTEIKYTETLQYGNSNIVGEKTLRIPNSHIVRLKISRGE